MVRTLSTMLPLGTALPPFELAVVKGTNFVGNSELIDLEQFNSKMLDQNPIFLMIICAHCPFVKHIETELTNLDKDYGEKVQILAIASNSLITHPQDGPDYLAKQADEDDVEKALLADPQEIAQEP